MGVLPTRCRSPQKPRCLAGFLLCVALAMGSLGTAASAARTAHVCQSPSVLRVHDGDTVSLRCGRGKPFKLRLASIDAPEQGQPYGSEATRALKRLIQGRRLHVETYAKDRYGRAIGDIFIGDASVSLQLVSEGLAWCGQRPSRACRQRMQRARTGRRGLWRQAEPIEPWKWRKLHPPYSSAKR